MPNNLHISLTDCRNETRLMKEARTLVEDGLYNKSFVLALHGEGLSVSEEVLDGSIVINRLRLISRSWGTNLLSQVIKYFEFLLRTLTYIKGRKIAAVTLHSLALLPIGLLCKAIYGVSVVYDAHELETEKNGLLGVRKALAKKLERWSIRYVDKTIVVSERIKDWYLSSYPKLTCPEVIFNSPSIQPVVNENLFRKEFGIADNDVICLYQGAMEKGRGIELLVKAFKERNDDFVLVLMGYGSLVEEILPAIDDCKIFYKEAVPSDEVLRYTVSADIGIALGENICLSYYYSMPNKLFEFCMAGLPVVSTPLIEIRDFLFRYNAGLTIEDESIEGIDSALNQIRQSDLPTLSKNARRAAEENSWDLQRIKLVKLYKDLQEYS